MSGLFDHALREKYNSMKINDPLIFIKNAIDWDAFTQIIYLKAAEINVP